MASVVRRHGWSFLFLLMLCFGNRLHSQPGTFSTGGDKIPLREAAQKSFRRSSPLSFASPWLDVTYYRLNLTILPTDPVVRGSVAASARTTIDQPRLLTYDLANTMTVDSVSFNGAPASFSQQSATVTIRIDSTTHVGDIVTTEIFYHGTPRPTGLGSFINSSDNGHPWIWSLSEPYGARDWWPCKDSPDDKADSADIVITTDSSELVGSNGALAALSINGNGTKSWHWKERYPIATYLISVAIGPYAQFSLWFHASPADSLQILNYVLPESLASARIGLARAVDGLALFSKLFGAYPFSAEKYGHTQFGGHAMEHQTMTSTETFEEETIIHELAHQWFGDMITCRSWRDLWLNEGFATYCTALYYGATYGDSAYKSYIAVHLTRARTASGPVYAADTNDVRQLFSGARTYSKGAVVLHMLRHLIGDTLFFRAIAAYAHAPALRYATATTGDFESVVEQTVHADLGYFFREWIYGENYPHYTYWWTARDSNTGSRVTLTLRQSTGTSNPSFFTMPLDCRLTGPAGDTTITLMNNEARQTFTLAIPFRPTSMRIDDGNWILRDAVELPPPSPQNGIALSRNFPNPYRASTTVRYSLPRRFDVDVGVYNLLGEKVATLFHGVHTPGDYELVWTPAHLPSGLYFCLLRAGTVTLTQPMLFAR
jgi:aminopeptidase N